jgi:hypothetical protein
MTSRVLRALALPASAAALAAATLATQAFISVPAQSAAVHRAPSPASVVGWRVSATLSVPGKPVILLNVDAVSARDAWAAGVVVSGYGTSVRPLIAHWDGRTWRPVALPGKARPLATQSLFGYVGASSASNVWAVSVGGRYLRRDGRHWTQGRLPGSATGRLIVDSVRAFGPADVWAFGGRSSGPESKLRFAPYAARFDGRRWSTVKVPGRGPVSAVSAISRGDMWAVAGGQSPIVGVSANVSRVLHWNGTAWRDVAVEPRLPRRAYFTSILARARNDIWAGGSVLNRRQGTSELVMHWNGKAWARVSPPSVATEQDHVISAFAPDGRRGIWALGANLGGAARLWRFSGRAWSAPIRLPWDLYQLEAVPGTGSIWALGENLAATAGLIVRHGPVPR